MSRSSCWLTGAIPVEVMTVRKAAPVDLDPGARTSAAFLAITTECIAHWRLNVPDVIDGRAMESLHQTRVGIRRFRSALSLFLRVIDDPQVGWLNDEIRELALPLGEARDLDVFLADDVTDCLSEAQRAVLRERREAAYDDVIEVLGSQRWADAWALVDRFRAHAPWGLDPDPPAVDTATEALERRWQRVVRRVGRLGELSPSDRHRVRIQAKKLRYGAQFFAGLYPAAGGYPVEFAGVVGGLQDALGLLNDAHTRGLILKSVGAEVPVIDEPALVSEATAALSTVASLRPFWR